MPKRWDPYSTPVLKSDYVVTVNVSIWLMWTNLSSPKCGLNNLLFYICKIHLLLSFCKCYQLWSSPGVLNLLILTYPQIKIVPLCVPPKSELYALRIPPNQKFYPKGLLLSIFLNFAYPLCPSHVPLGVLIPQVENHWSSPNNWHLLY